MSEATTRRPRLTQLAAALLAVAVALALWAGMSWSAAANDEDAAYARARDAAMEAGEQGVVNLNTLDYRDVATGLAGWRESATGELLQQLDKGRAEFEKQVREAKTTTSAKVLAAALTELDERAGKARIVVAVRITVDTADGKPQAKESRMLGELTRTADGWKLSALGQAPVGDAASGQN
ncbi:hypothetical protein AB0M28_05460 [Streptomyces sp. NPDC051940]|uniref:hypothetical protein n=1 Tax=Streptomyces sp. NPDC051940 TaxID=3155675 RepID=UPI00341D51F1